MAITVAPKPRTLKWSNFAEVDSLSGNEHAHIDMDYNIPKK